VTDPVFGYGSDERSYCGSIGNVAETFKLCRFVGRVNSGAFGTGKLSPKLKMIGSLRIPFCPYESWKLKKSIGILTLETNWLRAGISQL
jgi:hypothetical protein